MNQTDGAGALGTEHLGPLPSGVTEPLTQNIDDHAQSFLIHPDYPGNVLRAAHDNHFHAQFGKTKV